MEVHGAVILITGASSGIGAAAARAFDRAGASLVLAARRRDALDAVAAGMRSALVVPTDLAERGTAPALVEAAISRFGRLDVLINNAASLTAARSDSLTAAELHAALQTNFLAALEATQAAVRQMRKQGGGQIINIGSPVAFFGLPLMAAYAGSKAALSGWTRSMQAEWAGSAIVVTEYLPGRVATGSRVRSAMGELGPEVFDDPRQGTLARLLLRPQSPEEVGEQLVACVRRPRAIAYSGLAARLVAVLAAFPSLRQRLAAGLARVVRDRLGIGVFAPLPDAAPRRTAAAPARAAAAVAPALVPPPRAERPAMSAVAAPAAVMPALGPPARAEQPRAAAAPQPPAVPAVAAPAAAAPAAVMPALGPPARAEQPRAAAVPQPPAVPAVAAPAGAAPAAVMPALGPPARAEQPRAAAVPQPPAVPAVAAPAGAAPAAAQDSVERPAAVTAPGATAGKVPAAKAAKAVKAPAAARAGKRALRAGEDEAARELSPIMSERVRAAAEKAAASARGGRTSPAAKGRAASASGAGKKSPGDAGSED